MIPESPIKIIDNDLNKKENEKKYQITKYFQHFKEYKKTINLKKKLHEELDQAFKLKEKQKQFHNVLENSLNGICTICHEELNFNKNDIYYSILSCLVKYNKCFYCFAPTVLNCGHVYHHNCLEKWFNYSHDQMCPNCGI